jgi:hypothetical protein
MQGYVHCTIKDTIKNQVTKIINKVQLEYILQKVRDINGTISTKSTCTVFKLVQSMSINTTISLTITQITA